MPEIDQKIKTSYNAFMKPLLSKPWPFIERILAAHPKAEIFVVGGAVRDHLLGLPVKDYDLVVRHVPMDDLAATLEPLGKTDIVGKRFGVIKFRPQGQDAFIDIALPRKEFSWAFTGGYRDFDIQSDPELPIEEDLSRRDFTVNAMAYNVATQTIIDPFFGQKDLVSKTIRTVGPAALRFQEDYSRMLRAVRFACRLNFGLSEHTAAAIKKLGYHLDDKIDADWVVSREIISQEFLKAFEANDARCLTMLDTLGLLETILPEVKALQTCKQTPPYHLEGTAYDHLLLALNSTRNEGWPLLSKLAILFHDIGKIKAATTKDGIIHFYGHEKIGAEMTKGICDRLLLDKQLPWIVAEHLFAIKHKNQTIKRTLLEAMFFSPRHPGQSLIHCMIADQRASVPAQAETAPTPIDALLAQIKAMAPTGVLPPPLISGDDVLQWLAIKPGPRVAEVLEAVREEQLNGRLADKAAAKQFVISL